MELGESKGWAGSKPIPPAIHSEGRVRGSMERDGRPVVGLPANVVTAQGGGREAREARGMVRVAGGGSDHFGYGR